MTTITATEAARRFSDLINRVHYRDESFQIVRNGEPVARLSAAKRKTMNLKTFLERLSQLESSDPTFADDLDTIRSEQPPLDEDSWES